MENGAGVASIDGHFNGRPDAEEWRIEGKLRRGWQSGEGQSTITLPRVPTEFARTLLRRVGCERAKEYQAALGIQLDVGLASAVSPVR